MADSMGIKPNLGPVFSYDVTNHPDERFVSRDPQLMIALATLSRGNVQLGDNPENTNIDIIAPCCNINGEIITPDKSIGPLSVGIVTIKVTTSIDILNDKNFYPVQVLLSYRAKPKFGRDGMANVLLS